MAYEAIERAGRDRLFCIDQMTSNNSGMRVKGRAHQNPRKIRQQSAATAAKAQRTMSRDLAASCSLATNNHSSIGREGTSAVSRSFAVIPAEEDAGLIMRRLLREYLEHRSIRATSAVRSMPARS
jgi:hypothetical protein